jgi:Fic family protein
MLCEEHTLSEPILYLSLFLKKHRTRYYELLQLVREKGDWETWLEFFLDGVAETAEQGAETARRMLALFDKDKAKISGLGRATASALRVHGELQRTPLLSVPVMAKRLKLSQPTVQKSLDHLADLGVVQEITGKRRSRLYQYAKYLKILDEGTEPLRQSD